MLIKIRQQEYQAAWQAFEKARREFQDHIITEAEFLHAHRVAREAQEALIKAEETDYADD